MFDNSSLRLGYRLALLIALLLIVSGAITTALTIRDVVRSTTAAAIESMVNGHRAVSDLIENADQDMQRYAEHELALRKQELVDMTTSVTASLDTLREARRGQSEAGTQQMARELLGAVRYRKNDYFFAMDRDGLMVEHPDPQFDGKNLMDMQDRNGKYVFRDMIEIAFTKGEGFENYLWKRPKSNLPPAPKVTHVVRYPAWDWVIGTGVFLDDIDAEAAKRVAETKATLSRVFADIRFNSAGFFFVLDTQGRLVVSPQGRDMRAIQSTGWGRELTGALLAARARTDHTITSLEHEAALRDGRSEPWLFKVSSFHQLGWTLVSAVPSAEIHRPGRVLALKQVVIGMLVLCIGLLIGLLVSRRLVQPVEAMTRAAVALEEDRFEPDELADAVKRSDEIGTLARALQRMGNEIVERERQLRAQVTTLSVVVDRSRVAREVQQITESDFFQNLQVRAQEMRAQHRGPVASQSDETPASPIVPRP